FISTRTAPPASYTLSLHDALPTSRPRVPVLTLACARRRLSRAARESLRRSTSTSAFSRRSLAAASSPPLSVPARSQAMPRARTRSEEHTSELQSRENLVCRLLLEK